MSTDLDDLLDPARLAALWSKPIARAATLASAPGSAPAARPAALAVTPHLVLVESERAASPERVQALRPDPIDVHAHLRELVRAIDDELGAHFDPTSPPRRALDAHIDLLRARLAIAGPGGAPAAAAEILPLLDQIEDLLEALLRAGPWNA